MELRSRIHGSYYGVAIGDALGSVVEFLPKPFVSLRYGEIKGYVSIIPFLKTKPFTTDDTDMTVAIAKALFSGKYKNQEIYGIESEFVKYAKTFPLTIGKTTLFVFLFNLYFKNLIKSSEFIDTLLNGKTAGNGSLMRITPFAFLNNKEQALLLVRQQSKLTHFSPIATEACDILFHVLWDIKTGSSLQQAIIENTINTRYEDFLNKEYTPVSGYVVDTLFTVLKIAYYSTSFEESILFAINIGGDTDTVGAILGGLLGMYYGIDGIPDKLLSPLRSSTKDDLSIISYLTFLRLNNNKTT